MGVANVTVTLRSSRQVVKRICEIDKEPEDWRWQDVFGFVDFLASHLAEAFGAIDGSVGYSFEWKEQDSDAPRGSYTLTVRLKFLGDILSANTAPLALNPENIGIACAALSRSVRGVRRPGALIHVPAPTFKLLQGGKAGAEG